MINFSAKQRERITAAIKAAETKTSCEILAAFARVSGNYTDTIYKGGIVAALLFGLFAPLVYRFSGNHIYLYLAGMVVFSAITYLCFSVSPKLVRTFTRNSRMYDNVWHRAIRLFAERQAYRTSAKNGVVILASELERSAVIFPDEAVAEKVGQASFENALETLRWGLSAGQNDEAATLTYIAVIDQLAKTLGEHFPLAAGDTNELPNGFSVIE